MRAVSKNLGEHFRPVRLYRDDLERIIRTLLRDCASLEIRVGEFEFDSIDELVREGPVKARSFGISGRDPYISLSSDGGRPVWLYAATDDAKSAGLWHRLKDALISARPKPYFLYSYWYFIAYLLFVQVAIYFIVPRLLDTWTVIEAVVEVGLLVILIVWAIVGLGSLLTGDCCVYPRKYRNEDTFWARHRNQIVSGIISAAIAASTWLMTYVYMKPR